jgi:hypothetical protein
MIKHFNTAMSTGASSGASGKKGTGMGTFVMIALLAVGGYFAYRYIQRRNQLVVVENED